MPRMIRRSPSQQAYEQQRLAMLGIWLHNFASIYSRFMGILFRGFWTIRLDRIVYSLVPDPNVTAKILLNFKTLTGPSLILWSWLLYPREEPDSWSPYSTTEPDPTACDPRSGRCDPWSHIPRNDPVISKQARLNAAVRAFFFYFGVLLAFMFIFETENRIK